MRWLVLCAVPVASFACDHVCVLDICPDPYRSEHVPGPCRSAAIFGTSPPLTQRVCRYGFDAGAPTGAACDSQLMEDVQVHDEASNDTATYHYDGEHALTGIDLFGYYNSKHAHRDSWDLAGRGMAITGGMLRHDGVAFPLLGVDLADPPEEFYAAFDAVATTWLDGGQRRVRSSTDISGATNLDSYRFDTDGRLVAIDHCFQCDTAEQFTPAEVFTYDGDRLVHRSWLAPHETPIERSYAYDSGGNLMEIITTGALPGREVFDYSCR